MENINSFWFYLPFMIIVAFLGYFMPLLTRRNIIFGVKFPLKLVKNKKVVQLKNRFKITLPIFMLFFILFAGLFLSKTDTINLGGFLIIIQLLIVFVFYTYFNRKLKRIKSNINLPGHREESSVTIETSFHNKQLTINSLWYLIPLALVIINFVIVALNYSSIPVEVPLKYSLKGEPISFTAKNFLSAFMMPLMSAFFVLLFFFINYIIKKSKQNIDGTSPQKSAIQNRIFRYKWSKFTFFSGTALIISFFLSSLGQLGIYPLPAYYTFIFTMIIVFSIVLSAIYLSLKLGQSGARIKIDMDIEEEESSFSDDDKFWKSGLFYYNPDDPAIFVEKRIGIGWTMNFANPVALALSVGLIAIIVISIVLGIG